MSQRWDLFHEPLKRASLLDASPSCTSRSLAWLKERVPRLSGRRSRVLIGASICSIYLLYMYYPAFAGVHHLDFQSSLLGRRRSEIAAGFQHAWDGYSKYCFGHDSLRPVSNTCEDDFGGWGVSAVDSLSTAIIMGKEDVAIQIVQFIKDLDFHNVTGGTKVQVFEVTIRHFGGMISAWDLLKGPFSNMIKDEELRRGLYDKMVELGDILSCSFDTPSGVPRDWLDPASCQTDSGTTNTVAGVGTMILEFARLSDITGNDKYVRLAEKAEGYLLNPRGGQPYPGLLGSSVSIDDGDIVSSGGSWGALSDSFYEYLMKAYIYDSRKYRTYLDRWLLAAESTMKYIGSHPYRHPEWTMLSTWDGSSLTKSMETLVWFAGGNFILGGMVTKNQTLVDYGLSLADAAGAIYNMTATGLGPEFVGWSTDCDSTTGDSCDAPYGAFRITDGRYRLRPEVIETWYYAYRATRNPKYVAWAWATYEAINRYCRTDSGFSAIKDVNAVDGGGMLDREESFVFAEVLKYVYLIHLEDAPYHVQDSRHWAKNTWVFNTEAHPFRVVGPPV